MPLEPKAASVGPRTRLRTGRCVIVGEVAAVARLAELEGESVGSRAADHELLEMHGAMVQVAQSREVGQ